MLRHLLPAALAIAVCAPALGQSDAEFRRILRDLSAVPDTDRGIRMPAQQPPAAATPAPAAAAPAPAAPATPAAPAVAAPAAQAAPRVAATPAPTATTAPPGVAATSITIGFASGSAEVTAATMPVVETLARVLATPQLAEQRFRIEGHTDSVGSAEANQALSERRAAAVRDLLVGRFGIAPSRLEAVGRGESELLVRTPDETPEARNRRVQVLNLGR